MILKFTEVTDTLKHQPLIVDTTGIAISCRKGRYVEIQTPSRSDLVVKETIEEIEAMIKAGGIYGIHP